MIASTIDGGVEVLAPAKLNLFLDILGKRPDGYHELETLMLAIDLHDRLRFEPEDSGRIALSCDDPSLPTGPGNLAVRAAEALRAYAESTRPGPFGARIDLRKSIPDRAGLGGGSSDAAATLSGLDRLWGLATPPGELDRLAATIGSDVPFFLHGPSAVCRGRGERVEPVDATPDGYWFVLICPPLGVRTPDVFAALDVPAEPARVGPALDAFRAGDPARLGRHLTNRLQPVAERLEPGLGRVREALEQLGPSLDGHLMSGSGSAYFGLARDRAAADIAARRLGDQGLGMVRVVRGGHRA